MKILYRLPPPSPNEPAGGLVGRCGEECTDVRILLKYPFGILIPHEGKTAIRVLSMIMGVLGSSNLYIVGDYVTSLAITSGLEFKLSIIDGRVMRRDYSGVKPERFLKAVNPPGTITDEAIKAISEALKRGVRFLVVDGEEDMLALPLITMVDEGSVVAYGHPRLGVVAVFCDKSKKEAAKKVLERIRVGRDD